MDITIPLAPVVMRAALPVVRGQSLVWSGELMVGRTKIHIVGSTPLADAERAWERLTGYAAKQRKIPLRLGDVLDEETGDLRPGIDETEGVFDDVVNFMTASPVGKTIEAAASFVPGLNVASSAAFGAAKLYKAARGQARKVGRHPVTTRVERQRAPLPTSKVLRGPVDIARSMQRQLTPQLQAQGRRVQQFSEEDLMRAAQAVELLERARAGHPEALKVIGKMRTTPHAPGSSHHLDLLALDAAQLVGPAGGDDAAAEFEQLAVEGLAGVGGPSVSAPLATSGRTGVEVINAERLRSAFEGGRACGC